LKDQRQNGKGHKTRLGSSHTGTSKALKRRPTTDDEDDDMGGPKDPQKPTFMATKASRGDVNEAFGKDAEGNLAMFDHTLAITATKTLPIREAWIVDSGCA
jgi:hypothetical protein